MSSSYVVAVEAAVPGRLPYCYVCYSVIGPQGNMSQIWEVEYMQYQTELCDSFLEFWIFIGLLPTFHWPSASLKYLQWLRIWETTALHWAIDQFLYSYIEDLVQNCSNSIANALELLQSCTKPSMSRWLSWEMLTSLPVNGVQSCSASHRSISHGCDTGTADALVPVDIVPIGPRDQQFWTKLLGLQNLQFFLLTLDTI